MAADTNTATEGILSTYPKAEITVIDAHGSMANIDPNNLHNDDRKNPKDRNMSPIAPHSTQ